MTNMADTRSPILPSYSLSVAHAGRPVVANATAAAVEAAAL